MYNNQLFTATCLTDSQGVAFLPLSRTLKVSHLKIPSSDLMQSYLGLQLDFLGEKMQIHTKIKIQKQTNKNKRLCSKGKFKT